MNLTGARRIEVSLSGVGAGSATASFTEHAISKLRAAAAKMDSYRRMGFTLSYISASQPLTITMINPGPKRRREELNRLLDQPIDHGRGSFYLSTKVITALNNAGITTVRQLVDYTDEELLYGKRKIKGLGHRGVAEIRTRLDHENLRLGMLREEPQW